jgi:hypothetical protein
MMETVAGLPNSCSKCAKKITTEQTWFADNADAARAGAGLCNTCAYPNPVKIVIEATEEASQPKIPEPIAQPKPIAAKRKVKRDRV